jgi:hypothetical protein
VKPNLPRDVTLIHKGDLGRASVIRLTSAGARYYHGRSLHKQDGQIELGNSWQYERKDYLVVDGQRWDLVEKVRKAAEDYRKACQEHDRARERAIWEARDSWDTAHPRPELPRAEELIGDEQCTPSTSC